MKEAQIVIQRGTGTQPQSVSALPWCFFVHVWLAFYRLWWHYCCTTQLMHYFLIILHWYKKKRPVNVLTVIVISTSPLVHMFLFLFVKLKSFIISSANKLCHCNNVLVWLPYCFTRHSFFIAVKVKTSHLNHKAVLAWLYMHCMLGKS